MTQHNRKLRDRVQLLIDEVLHTLGDAAASGADPERARMMQLARLEERVLLSASPIAAVAEMTAMTSELLAVVGTESGEQPGVGAHIVDSEAETMSDSAFTLYGADSRQSTPESALPQSAATKRGPELIVIDSRVQAPDTLLAELLNKDRDVRLLRLNVDTDGIRQITEKLEQISNVSAVHLLTHGRDGEILLGSTHLNAGTLAQYAPELLAWQHSLTTNADLLLYGCDVAESTEGQDFIESLSRLSDADVAASTDSTGSHSLGGNWKFEYQTGVIESSMAFNADVQENWQGLLATFVVTNTNDSGGGSLRQAILDANANSGLDTITFNIADTAGGHFYYRNDGIAGSLTNVQATTVADTFITDFDPDYPYAQHSWFQINLAATSGALGITSPVMIDGYSQSGAAQNTLAIGQNANLRIELTSSGADWDDGLDFLAGSSGSTVQGLAINSFDYAGVWMDPGVNSVTVQGNFLGTDITGTIARGNGDGGLHIRSGGNLIGGPDPADRNLISGGANRGVVTFTFGPVEANNVVQNNYIGVDATGTRGLGNTGVGIQVYNQNNMQILDNVISDNSTAGIKLYPGSTANNTVIQGNLIGLGADGVTALGNGGAGISIENASTNTTIGGILAGQANTIAYNAADGVAVSRGSGTAIRGNSIFGNVGMGIDLLGVNGVNNNDLGDGDSGPNALQNYPDIISAVVAGTDLTIAGTLNTRASSTRILDFYWSGTADLTLHGEAETYIGSTSVTTDISGNAIFSQTFGGVSLPAGAVITATAADSSGNTSEFSLNRAVVAANTAPVLDSAAVPVLASVNEDLGAPVGAVGTLVRSLVDFVGGGGLDNVTDSDGGALLGIAVTRADVTNGIWYYSTNDGTTWRPLGAVSDANAMLLAADAGTRLYFQPHAEWNGTVANGVTFHIWDRTSGTAGGTASVLSTASTVLDQFSSNSYSRNDGTANWSSTWVENDSNGGGASGGRIQVNAGKLDIRADSSGDSIYREVNLSGATSAKLSFDYVNKLKGLDQIDVEISSDGGANYSTVATISDSTRAGSGSMSLDITPFISANTRVRFYVSVSDQAKDATIDDVQISFGIGTGGSSAFSSASDTASITVNPVNDPPVITSNGAGTTAALSVPENTTAVTTVTAADVDLPAQSLTHSISGGTDAAQFAINSLTGILSFVSAPDFEMPTDADNDNIYRVTVRVSDGTFTDTQALAVTVLNVNESPVATAIADVNTLEDAPTAGFSIASAFSDPDGDALHYRVHVVSQSPGLLSGISVNPNSGLLNYSPGQNCFGSAVIRVTATDAGGVTASSLFSIFVHPVNDAPVAQNFSATVNSGSALTSLAPGVLAGATDAEQGPLQAIFVRQPSFGILVIRTDGSFDYRPNNEFFGVDSFQFAATDGVLTSSTATATLQVLPVGSNTGGGSSNEKPETGGTSGSSGGSGSGLTGGLTSDSAPVAGQGSENNFGTNTGPASSFAGGPITSNADLSDDDEETTVTISSVDPQNDVQDSAVRTFVIFAAQDVSDGLSGSFGTIRRAEGATLEQFLAGHQFLSPEDSALRELQSQREIIYRHLVATSHRQMESFEEELTQRVSAASRVVGSVGVVTTGFSVGYLLWAVRGGMLLSGLLAQMPAWTMLDPLLVIDGNPRNDDKESLQTIMDRQQAKLTPIAPAKT